MNLSDQQQKRFWELAKEDLSGDVIAKEDGSVYLQRSARFLKEKVRGIDIQWAALSAFELTIRLNTVESAPLLAKFFSGEGFLIEQEHWREGTYHVFLLELMPTVVVSD